MAITSISFGTRDPWSSKSRCCHGRVGSQHRMLKKNLQRIFQWAKGTPAIVTIPPTRAISHTILGVISAMGVVNIEIRLPNMKPKRIKVDGARKRKQPLPKKALSKGTVTGHYILFLQDTMNFMDQYPDIKGFYIVMDNAPNTHCWRHRTNDYKKEDTEAFNFLRIC